MILARFQKPFATLIVLGIVFQQSLLALAYTVPVNLTIPAGVTNAQNTAANALTSVQGGVQKFERISGVPLQDILAVAGLKSEKYGACTSSQALGTLANVIQNFDKLLQAAVMDFLQQFFKSVAKSLIYCVLSDIQKELGASVGLSAKLLIRIAPQCKIDIASSAGEAFKQIKNRELQQNFIARCVARIALKDTVDLINQVVQTGGLEGGAAYVTSWTNLYIDEDARGIARFYTELVNADICPYFKQRIFEYYQVPQSYIDDPPTAAGIAFRADGGTPFIQSASCTLPKDFDPYNVTEENYYTWGGADLLTRIDEPQNNFIGFIGIAEVEAAKQRNLAVSSRVNEAVAGRGFLSKQGCAAWSPDGATCLQGGPIEQPAGAIADYNQIAFDQQVAWLVSADANKKPIDDIKADIANRLFDLANQPLPLTIELGKEDDPKNFAPSPTPTPVTGSGDPNDPACTGGNPLCTCVRNDQTVQASLTPIVAAAMTAAQQSNPALFDAGTSHIAAGVNLRDVLKAICDNIGSQACKPSPSQDNVIIITGGGQTFSVDVITPDGNLRTNGGQPLLACAPGVQD